ncbi:MAG: hypothetical protein L0H78_24075, partial [Humibacillus sp.]|nr:hypothetical protein [Humibacillus sp.]
MLGHPQRVLLRQRTELVGDPAVDLFARDSLPDPGLRQTWRLRREPGSTALFGRSTTSATGAVIAPLGGAGLLIAPAGIAPTRPVPIEGPGAFAG